MTTRFAPGRADGAGSALLSASKQIAGWAALFLGLAVALAGIGGGMGTMERLWPKRRAAGDTP